MLDPYSSKRCCACLRCRLGEEGEALQYHLEAHRADPTGLDTISWLGAQHVRQQDYAGAIPYFNKAAAVQPKEVRGQHWFVLEWGWNGNWVGTTFCCWAVTPFLKAFCWASELAE